MDNYRTFLRRIIDELLEAIRECENSEWHHRPEGSAEWQHYNRLWTWMQEIEIRLQRYDGATKR